MASARFWLACGVSGVVLAACGSDDSTRSSRDEGAGAGGESSAGAPPNGGKAGAEPTAGMGATEPQPEAGSGGMPEGSAGMPVVEGGGGAGPEPLSALVEPKYPTNGPFWLDYVKNDGDSRTEATDTACAPTTDGPTYDACVHGGEIRRVALPTVASCDGIEASDGLAAFDWICQPAGEGVEVVSTGLAQGKHMSDLIDFGGNGWKPNAVAITLDDAALVSTEPAIWWENPFVRLAGTMCTADVGEPHTILLLDASSSNANCTGTSEKIGIATVPGETVTDFAFTGRGAFNWYEGEYTMTTRFTVVTPGNFGFQVVRNMSLQATVPGSSFAGAISMAAARASVVRNIEAVGGRIVVGALSAVGLRISDVVSDGARVDAISIGSCSDCSIERVELTNTVNRAINVGNGPNPRLLIRDVIAADNGSGGIQMQQVNDSRIENVSVSRAGGAGVSAVISARNVFKSISVNGSANAGVSVDQGDDNRLVDIHVADAGSNGVTLGGNRAVLQHARISCGKGAGTTGTGVALLANNATSRVYDVTTSSCRYGVHMAGSANLVQGVTVAATEDVGFYNATYALYLEDAVAIDTTYGLYFLSAAFGPPRVRNFASTHNLSGSVYSNNSTVDFGERLIVGTNGMSGTGPDCVVTSTTGLAADCSSGATLTTAASVLGSIVGLVSDTTNPQGSTGAANYDTITDHLTFATDTRRFIRAGAGFPDYAMRGPCRDTESCAILDLALKANDTLLRNRNALPTGNDVATQNWLIQNSDPTNQAACDTRLPGSTFVAGTPNRCESVFLKHAWELLDDGDGDDDGLCESGETCEFARNLGGYQGHGSFVSAGAFTNGILTDITLVQREHNGY